MTNSADAPQKAGSERDHPPPAASVAQGNGGMLPLSETLHNAKESVRGGLSDTRDSAAKGISQATGWPESGVRTALPLVAVAGTGIVGWLLLEPLTKLGKMVTGSVKAVFSGFGLFKKIPVLREISNGADWILDIIGESSGMLMTGAAALIGYQMLSDGTRKNKVFSPSNGTGAVGEPPITTDLSVYRPGGSTPVITRSVPAEPAPVKVPDKIPADIAGLAYPQLYERRESIDGEIKASEAKKEETEKKLEALRGSDPDAFEDRRRTDVGMLLADSASLASPEHSAYLRKLDDTSTIMATQMRYLNHLYENRREYAKALQQYNGDGGHSPRADLIAGLEGVGLSHDNATRIIPEAPPIPPTIFANGNDLSPDLIRFGVEYENLYGFQQTSVTKTEPDGSSRQVYLYFDDEKAKRHGLPVMKVTQKAEFLDKAIRDAQSRYELIAKCPEDGGFAMSVDGGGSAEGHKYKTFKDWSKSSWSQYFGWGGSTNLLYKDSHGKDEAGNIIVLTYKNEWETLCGMNGDTPIGTWMGVSHGETTTWHGNGLNDASKGFRHWRELLEQHRGRLADAAKTDGEIDKFRSALKLSQQRLEVLRHSGLAVLEHGRERDGAAEKDVLHAVDLRQNEVTLIGEMVEGEKFRLEKVWRNAPGSVDPNAHIEVTFNGNKPTIDLSNGDGLASVLAEMDRQSVLREALAAGRKAQAALPSPDTASRPAMPSQPPGVSR